MSGIRLRDMDIKHSRPSLIKPASGIALVLVLLAAEIGVVSYGTNVIRVLREDIEINVDIRDPLLEQQADTASDSIAYRLKTYLEKQAFTLSASVITKEEALKMVSDAEGTDIGEFLGYNPLFASISLKLNADYVHEDSLANIKKYILQNPDVREVSWPKDIVKMKAYLRAVYVVIGCVSLIILAGIGFTLKFVIRQFKIHIVKKS